MKVFHTGQGTQGIMRPPSKQQLEAVFDTTKVDDVVLFILENGELLAASKFHPNLCLVLLFVLNHIPPSVQPQRMATRLPMIQSKVTTPRLPAAVDMEVAKVYQGTKKGMQTQ